MIGERVKALREASGLSLRDLAERSGVSAPMLSQVERGETSPSITVAARIAAGLELTLSQLLRLDEGGTVTIVRARQRRRGGSARRRSQLRGADRAPAGPAGRALAPHARGRRGATGAQDDPPMHEPGSRETALVESGSVVLVCDGAAPPARRRRLRDLRRRPAAPLRESGGRAGRVPRRPVRRPEKELTMPKTMFEKIWEAHELDGSGLLYIDLHLVHEVTSPQAFDALRMAGRGVRRPDRTLATADHNTPTDGTAVGGPDPRRALARAGPDARAQLRGVRDPRLLARLRAPGDRARDRPRARRHPAGHDDRVRRLAHLHPRRLRRARLRDRHQRGRARAGHPVPDRSRVPTRCACSTAASSATA